MPAASVRNNVVQHERRLTVAGPLGHRAALGVLPPVGEAIDAIGECPAAQPLLHFEADGVHVVRPTVAAADGHTLGLQSLDEVIAVDAVPPFAGEPQDDDRQAALRALRMQNAGLDAGMPRILARNVS